MKALGCALILSLLANCGSDAAKSEERGIYDRLALAVVGLAFPHTRARLAECIERNDKPCLSAYNSVRAAAKELKAMPKEQALSETLATAERGCPRQRGGKLDFECVGAQIGLSYFTSPESNQMILDRLVAMPVDARSAILSESSSAFWLATRADKDRWSRELGDLEMSPAGKENVQRSLLSQDAFTIEILEVISVE